MPTKHHTVVVTGAEPERLEELRATSTDHAGNAVSPFVDVEGRWPLRCCLEDSRPGDVLAIVAWSPFRWRGAYAELGPIVIHAQMCAGVVGTGVPPQFLTRRQVVRPYGHDHRIAYDDIAIVDGDGSLPRVLAATLDRDHIDFVLVRNVASGCYSFTASRSQE